MRVGDICRVINPREASSCSALDYYDKLVILAHVDSPKAENKSFGVIRLDDGIYHRGLMKTSLNL